MVKPYVIDVHAHLGRSLFEEASATPEKLIELMKESGIDKAVISPTQGYEQSEGIKNTMFENDRIANAVREHPDRFPCGLAALEPLQGEKCIEELDRVHDELGLKGLVFHHTFQGCCMDNPVMFKIMGRAAKRKMVVFIHTDDRGFLESPWRLGRLAEVFPEVTIINGHPGMSIEQLENSIWVAKKYENVLLDTALMCKHMSPLEKAVEAIGAERILFGSDMPMYEGKSLDLAQVENARISDEEKELILSQNAARLFGIK